MAGKFQMTVKDWAIWASKRQRDADVVARQYKLEASQAREMVTQLGCLSCNPMVVVKDQAGHPVFKSPAVIHELTCTAD
jgi:hypothetical protein